MPAGRSPATFDAIGHCSAAASALGRALVERPGRARRRSLPVAHFFLGSAFFGSAGSSTVRTTVEVGRSVSTCGPFSWPTTIAS